jgi:ATP adenylyltransferase
MERLWTPWRMSYVGGTRVSGCVFCDKAAGDDDEANLVVFRGEHAYVLLNLYPYNSGHLMIAPYEHVGDIRALDAVVGAELFALCQRTVDALDREYHPHAFNVGLNLGEAAGGSISQHLHLHIVPRWQGDTNFMAVTADTKVLPETLDRTAARLRQHF